MGCSFFGRLRPLLLLWLLSSSEVLSVYASVTPAAPAAAQKTGKGGIFRAWRKGGNSNELSQQGSCPAGASKSGTCSAGGGSKALKVASVQRGGHSHGHHHHGSGAGADESADGIPLHVVKLLLTVCLTSLNVACWALPLKVRFNLCTAVPFRLRLELPDATSHILRAELCHGGSAVQNTVDTALIQASMSA